MAHSVDEFLKQNPDYHIVVLAGAGHIIYDSGIPKSLSPLPTLQLGIFPAEAGGRVQITNVESDSIAEKAGLKTNDILISIDDWKIETIADVRISIFDKKQGDTIKIKVLRKSPVGEKELEFTVIL